jgi:prolactin regulatory element-binding protein
MGSKNKNNVTDCLLARVNFPLYAAEMLTSRHLLVAGGGGSAKTGVANGFEIYELFHNGNNFVAEELVRHETGPSVIMNCALKNLERKSYLVVGQESHSQLYIINYKVGSEGEFESEKKDHHDNLRQRRGSQKKTEPNGKIPQPKRLYFEIKTGDSVQTDFTEKEPLQRIVRVSPNGKLMATGGIDGHVRVWHFPKMTKLVDISAHTKEIDDIDFTPDNKNLLSIAKDGIASMWSIKDGKEVLKLTWTPPEGVKYLFKRCRFAVIEGNPGKYRLFTLANPLGKTGKQKGFLQLWNTSTGKLNNIVEIDESLSALAVRDDGRFVAVGTMFTGSVSIYVAFSLQKVLHVNGAHAMFVTGLEFIPVTSKEAPPISSDVETSVISFSVDNRICIHSLRYRHTMPIWVAIILIIIVLFLTFMLCSYIGL